MLITLQNARQFEVTVDGTKVYSVGQQWVTLDWIGEASDWAAAAMVLCFAGPSTMCKYLQVNVLALDCALLPRGNLGRPCLECCGHARNPAVIAPQNVEQVPPTATHCHRIRRVPLRQCTAYILLPSKICKMDPLPYLYTTNANR